MLFIPCQPCSANCQCAAQATRGRQNAPRDCEGKNAGKPHPPHRIAYRGKPQAVQYPDDLMDSNQRQPQDASHQPISIAFEGVPDPGADDVNCAPGSVPASSSSPAHAGVAHEVTARAGRTGIVYHRKDILFPRHTYSHNTPHSTRRHIHARIPHTSPRSQHISTAGCFPTANKCRGVRA